MDQSTQTEQRSTVHDLRVNIGRKQRNVRGALGIVVLGISAGIIVQIVQEGSTFWLALLLLVLTQSGIQLLMEWNMGVCPVNALRGRQSMSGWFSIGKEEVPDQQRVKAARRATRKQLVLSILIAILVTGTVLLFQ